MKRIFNYYSETGTSSSKKRELVLKQSKPLSKEGAPGGTHRRPVCLCGVPAVPNSICMLLPVSRSLYFGRVVAIVPNGLFPQAVVRFTAASSARSFMSSTTMMDVGDAGATRARGWVAPKVPMSTITSFGQGLGMGELQVILCVHTWSTVMICKYNSFF